MIKEIFTSKEKKVEYVELIYDLIFVYIIGRNNALLHNVHGGFFSGGVFMAYVISTLAVIQIWNYTTYYININGRNGIRDHIFMFINMFLMYFMAEGIRDNWRGNMYHISWALVLVNVGAQYVIEMRNHKDEHDDMGRLKRMALILFCEAAIVFAAVPVKIMSTKVIITVLAILFGMFGTMFSGRKNSTCAGAVDFAHLSERAMLYVVFTFGEMIIAIASYFEGGVGENGIYFPFMAFLIVVGLFLSYEIMYDRIVDREMNTNGLYYMLIHIFLVLALNNITAALEFMHSAEVELIPKILFLIISFVVYYGSLFCMGKYSRAKRVKDKMFYIAVTIAAISFIALMLLFRNSMRINILITVMYVFGVVAYMGISLKRKEQILRE